VPGWTANAEIETVSRHQPRYLTDEGRLFFNSADGLVAQDENGTEDVYQYEPAGITEPSGIAGCGPETPGFVEAESGCVNAISSGSSAQESAFLDASETGGDVFFLTSSKLTGQDTDTAYDVYDAHQCTPGAPCPAAEATQPLPCETADSCKPAQSPQPELFGAPPSALFSGPGNLTPETPRSVKPKTAQQIRAEKLKQALKACKKDKRRQKRTRCERAARAKYGAHTANRRRR
jgi:cation transport regulator ChaB